MDKFDKFEKLDRKVEETLHEVETMDRRKFYRRLGAALESGD